mmetsp:Transcript_81655/g.227382  ORF Transcript_81655/g.227382 Transcript_81655/m.227382 type:complete len:281 (+) Transcript_81655:174-1016(+)
MPVDPNPRCGSLFIELAQNNSIALSSSLQSMTKSQNHLTTRASAAPITEVLRFQSSTSIRTAPCTVATKRFQSFGRAFATVRRRLLDPASAKMQLLVAVTSWNASQKARSSCATLCTNSVSALVAMKARRLSKVTLDQLSVGGQSRTACSRSCRSAIGFCSSRQSRNHFASPSPTAGHIQASASKPTASSHFSASVPSRASSTLGNCGKRSSRASGSQNVQPRGTLPLRLKPRRRPENFATPSSAPGRRRSISTPWSVKGSNKPCSSSNNRSAQRFSQSR